MGSRVPLDTLFFWLQLPLQQYSTKKGALEKIDKELSIIKSAAIEAFPVSFHAITENKNTSNHRATLVRKPARNKIVKALVRQISNRTPIFIEQKVD